MGCKASMCSDANDLLISQVFDDPDPPSPHQQSTMPLLQVCPKEDVASTLRSTSKLLFKQDPSYCDILLLLELWISEVFKEIEMSLASKEDIHTFISYDGRSLRITHTVDGLRNFSYINNFCIYACLLYTSPSPRDS